MLETDEVNDFLAHYGVKGMRWGVIRDQDGGGRRRGSSQKLTKEERAVLKEVGDSEHDSLLRKLKYGPEGEERKLTPKQKEYLKTAAKIAAGAAVYYGLKAAGERAVVNMTVGKDAPTELKSFWRNYQKPKIPFDFDNLSTDRITLEPGSILTRISSAREKNIRAGGFYAAYKPEDITRYKAALPIYWKQWGVANETGHGFQISIRAKNGVKAPSQKEAFEIFNDMMKKRGAVLPAGNKAKGMNFLAAAHSWVDKDDPITKNYFEHLKAWGFNGVLDFNDAGRLGEAPLRLLDSSEFEISKTAKLGTAAIRAAQSTITKVKHMINDVEDFLAHYGVKGMKWGVRKDRPGGVSRRVDRDAQKDAKEFAAAKAFYGTGAGNRRKLIKQTVEAKSKRIPGYKKAFDSHLDNQDMSKHASKAVKERKSTDRRTRNKQRAGAVARTLTGQMGTQAAFVAAAFAGTAYLKSPGGQANMRKAASKINDAANLVKQKQGAAKINDFLKNNM